MIQHIWTIICSMSIIDRQSNNISLINSLEQININSIPEEAEGRVPLIPISFEITSFWIRTDENLPTRGQARISLITPSGISFPANEFDVDLSNHLRTRTIMKINELPFKEFGIYNFRVEIQSGQENDYIIVANVPIHILLDKAE